jgi:hypothetical protein
MRFYLCGLKEPFASHAPWMHLARCMLDVQLLHPLLYILKDLICVAFRICSSPFGKLGSESGVCFTDLSTTLSCRLRCMISHYKSQYARSFRRRGKTIHVRQVRGSQTVTSGSSPSTPPKRKHSAVNLGHCISRMQANSLNSLGWTLTRRATASREESNLDTYEQLFNIYAQGSHWYYTCKERTSKDYGLL